MTEEDFNKIKGLVPSKTPKTKRKQRRENISKLEAAGAIDVEKVAEGPPEEGQVSVRQVSEDLMEDEESDINNVRLTKINNILERMTNTKVQPYPASFPPNQAVKNIIGVRKRDTKAESKVKAVPESKQRKIQDSKKKMQEFKQLYGKESVDLE